MVGKEGFICVQSRNTDTDVENRCVATEVGKEEQNEQQDVCIVYIYTLCIKWTSLSGKEVACNAGDVGSVHRVAKSQTRHSDLAHMHV